MLRRAKDFYGFAIGAVDGTIGKVHDFYFDDEQWVVRYVVVNTGPWLFGRLVLLSAGMFEPSVRDTQILRVDLTQEQIENSPSIDVAKPVSRQHLVALHDYYGWPVYWGGSPLMGSASIYPYPAVLEGAKLGILANAAADDEANQEDENPHLRSTREVTGYRIHATDGEIGHVEDFLVGERNWTLGYMLVDTKNWLPGRTAVVPPQWIKEVNWQEAIVYVSLTRQEIRESPEYDPNGPITPSYESLLLRHYRR